MLRINIPLIPTDWSLFISSARFTVSYAFLKSIKTAYSFFYFSLTPFSIMVCKKKIWSDVLLPLMKPICSGDDNFLRSIKFIRRFSRIELNSLAKAGPIARPL